MLCSFQSTKWWRWGGSNSWPLACKASALPAELHPHILFSKRNIFYNIYRSLSIEFLIFIKKWWAKVDSNHRPHDYQSCALASWAIGPYQALLWWRVPGSNRWPPACKAGALPAELTPHTRDSYFSRYILPVPSKLNNVTSQTTHLPLYWP